MNGCIGLVTGCDRGSAISMSILVIRHGGNPTQQVIPTCPLCHIIIVAVVISSASPVQLVKGWDRGRRRCRAPNDIGRGHGRRRSTVRATIRTNIQSRHPLPVLIRYVIDVLGIECIYDNTTSITSRMGSGTGERRVSEPEKQSKNNNPFSMLWLKKMQADDDYCVGDGLNRTIELPPFPRVEKCIHEHLFTMIPNWGCPGGSWRGGTMGEHGLGLNHPVGNHWGCL